MATPVRFTWHGMRHEFHEAAGVLYRIEPNGRKRSVSYQLAQRILDDVQHHEELAYWSRLEQLEKLRARDAAPPPEPKRSRVWLARRWTLRIFAGDTRDRLAFFEIGPLRIHLVRPQHAVGG